MKPIKLFLSILGACILLFCNSFSALGADIAQIDYYYGNTCSHCAEIKPFLEEIEKKNPHVRFNRIEVFANRENALAMQKVFEQYGIPRDDRGVPAILINNNFLIGSDIITANLEKEIAAIKTIQNKPNTTLRQEQLTLLAITGAAIVDSINPCAIFVLIVLLSSLLVMKTPGDRQIKTCAATFVFSVYLAYFLIGVGLLYTIDFFGISAWLYRAVGILALVIGLLNIKDAFFFGAGGFIMEIPLRWRPALMKVLMKVSTPWGAFVSGFVVTLFEAPCTGGPYLFAIGLLAQNMEWGTIVPILLYYNFVFVLPLIIIATVVIQGKVQVDRAEAWQKGNIRKFHLVGGLIMLGLGLWMLLN